MSRGWFKSPPLATLMKPRVSAKAPDFFAAVRQRRVTEKSRKPLFELDFFELAQSGGSEQNSVSIALKPPSGAAFFNR
jgi:hypothetical protein